MERGERGDVPPCALARRRGRADAGAVRDAAQGGGRRLRALFPGLPVRAVGRQERPRGARQRAVRDRRRGLTDRKSGALPSSLALVGAGKMGGAMLEGWLAVGLDPSAVAVIEPAPAPEIAALCDARGIRLNPENPRPAEIVVLAVKP